MGEWKSMADLYLRFYEVLIQLLNRGHEKNVKFLLGKGGWLG